MTLLAILLTFTALNVQSRGLHFGIISAVKDKVKEIVEVQEERIRQEAILTISITAPADSAVVTGIITIAAAASDHKGISKVEFYIDGTLKAQDTSSPYAYSWNTAQYSAGLHTIKAIAYDTDNQTASDQHTVTSYSIASGWQNRLVDSVGGTASGTSLALDSNNNPQIAYAFANEDWTQSDLKYAQWTGSSWQVTTIDSSGAVGWWASLVLDSNNNPGIAYYDATNSDLKYAKRTGASWEITTVDSTGSLGSGTSLAFDSNNHPHISYADYTKGYYNLKYAQWTGTSWSTSTVDTSVDVGWSTSLALDSNNDPHIAYTDDVNNTVKYAHRTGSSWAIQTVNSTEVIDGHVSLALDTSNNPHIAYAAYGAFLQDLRYAHWNGSAWDITSVDVDIFGWYVSLKLDRNNSPYIAYSNDVSNNYSLKYAHMTGASWEITTVDSTQSAGVSISLALDFSSHPRIAYCNEAGDLKYATWNP